MKTGGHVWAFRARFRREAFGWKSQPAIARVREAVTEIKKVAKREPSIAAEGAVLFLERVSAALAHVDGSSGAIGSAVRRFASPRRPAGRGPATSISPGAAKGSCCLTRAEVKRSEREA
jgi:hypothetical protein